MANTHYLADQVAAHLDGRGVEISHEPEILDTGGGLKAALPLLDTDPVFTMNTDPLWLDANPLQVLADAWDGRFEALLLLAPAEAAGDFEMDREGRLTRRGRFMYTGAQINKTPWLRDYSSPIFSLNETWDRMIAEGALGGVVFPGRWIDVGTPEALGRAEAMLG